jgi:hypothetical protein
LANPVIVVSGGEMFSDVACEVSRSPVMLEPHVSPDWQWDFLQHFW